MLKRVLVVIVTILITILMILLLCGCWGGHCEMNGIPSDTVWILEEERELCV